MIKYEIFLRISFTHIKNRASYGTRYESLLKFKMFIGVFTIKPISNPYALNA